MIGVICNILFIWGYRCSLVSVVGCAAPSGGAQQILNVVSDL